MADIGLLAVVFTSGAALGATAEAIYQDRHKQPTRIVVAAKRVNNRLMPNYSRAQRRAHKRRQRG